MKLNADVVEIQNKILKLLAQDSVYSKYQGHGAKDMLREMLQGTDFGKSSLGDAGRLIFLESLRFHLKGAVFAFEAKMVGRAYSNQATPEEIQALYDAIERVIHKEKEKTEEPMIINEEAEEKNLEGFGETSVRDNKLFDTISGFFEETDQAHVMVSMPFNGFLDHEAIDIADVERYVLESAGPEMGTIKELASGLETVNDARLSVAVTFQACLHLDLVGKIELSQGVDDVLVKPKG